MRFALLLALFLAMTLPNTAAAIELQPKTYHVDVASGNDAWPGTEDRPFKTVTQASKLLHAGDRALIHKGIYHEQVMRGMSGVEGAPIIYEGVDRYGVIFQGSVLVKDWMKKGGLWVKRGLKPITDENAFVMVDEKRMLARAESTGDMSEGSFHLSSDGTYTIRLWGDRDPNQDHQVEVYELDLAFNAGDRWGGTARKWIVLRNMTIEKYGTFGISTDKEHPSDNSDWEIDRITARYNRGQGIFHALDDWYVHDCEFIRNGAHGCQLNGARVRFIDNFCAYNEWFGPSGDGGCGILIGPDASGHSCIISGNVFQDNGDPRGYGCGIYLEGRSHSNLIENNLIVGSTASGIGFFGSSNNMVINNVLVNIALSSDWDMAAAFVVEQSLDDEATQSVGNLTAHNTVWRCHTPIAVWPPTRDLAPTELNRFFNNLFVGCRFLGKLPKAATIIMEGNGFYTCPDRDTVTADSLKRWLKVLRGEHLMSDPGLYYSGNKVCSDPGLVAPAQGDFRLKADSPLIDSGVPLAEVTRDRDGNPRPNGRAPDIGAYEYSH
jgi:parallel beta-helix repeat protein